MSDSDFSLTRQLDSLCDEFENQWSVDERSDINQLLEQISVEHRGKLLQMLLEIEVELRQKAGLQVSGDDYSELGEQAVVYVGKLLAIGPQQTSTVAESVPFVERLVKTNTSHSESDTSAKEQSDDEAPVPSKAHTNGLEIQRQIDNYELIRRLGGGAMGDVFLARHHKFHDRFYAIKLLKANLVSEQAMARFEHEIDVAGRLEHPNVVFAFDAGRSGSEPYLVMEYIQGCNLQQLVQEQGPLDIAEACELIRQAADGLQYAFKSGLTHRDIKPSNLMLSHDYKIKVLDLGLARLREQGQSMGLTQEGQLLGTPDYMAPEQWSASNSVTTTADIYSLTCSLFALLTGAPPFRSTKRTSIASIMNAHINEAAPDIQDVRADIPKELAKLVSRCLAKDPAERCQTPMEFSEALDSFAADADLSKYDIAGELVGSNSLVPTRSIAGLSAQTNSIELDPETSTDSSFSRIGIGISIFVFAAIGIAILIIYGTSHDVPKTSTQKSRNIQQIPEDRVKSKTQFKIPIQYDGEPPKVISSESTRKTLYDDESFSITVEASDEAGIDKAELFIDKDYDGKMDQVYEEPFSPKTVGSKPGKKVEIQFPINDLKKYGLTPEQETLNPKTYTLGVILTDPFGSQSFAGPFNVTVKSRKKEVEEKKKAMQQEIAKKTPQRIEIDAIFRLNETEQGRRKPPTQLTLKLDPEGKAIPYRAGEKIVLKLKPGKYELIYDGLVNSTLDTIKVKGAFPFEVPPRASTGTIKLDMELTRDEEDKSP